jgi:hypothetical protein
MWAKRDGVDIPEMSAAWIDWHARFLDLGGNAIAARNAGCTGSYTRSALLAIETFGACPLSAFDDENRDNFNALPSWVSAHAADDFRCLSADFCYCYTASEVRRLLVECASPVEISIPVYAEIEENNGKNVLRGSGEYCGNHVWLVLGYEPGLWRVQTTWGRYGLDDSGVCIMSDDYFAKSYDRWGCTELRFDRS